MVHVPFNPATLATLKDKVVVLTGGATGIGRAAVLQFAEAGAHIHYGDIHPPFPLPSTLPLSTAQRITHHHCDTASYASQLSLFAAAHAAHGRIDIVVANAGVAHHRDMFALGAHGAAWNDIAQEPSMREIDVNLKGVVFSARIGVWYLRGNGSQGKGEGGGGGGDVVLVSSISGFKESAGLATYSASKHGVVGLMRGLHTDLIREDIRVNVICPWMTKTQMVTNIQQGWTALDLPTNEPEDVARSILLCATANRPLPSSTPFPHSTSSSWPPPSAPPPPPHTPFAGKILWIAGGEAYEIEDAIQRLEPEWLGRENSAVLRRGQDFLAGGGVSWDG